MLSADHPDAKERVPEKYTVHDYRHYKNNPLYETQTIGLKEDEEIDEEQLAAFNMEDYKKWKANLTKEKYDTLKGMLAYESKQEMAKQMLARMPKDKRNYLHVKIKKNPGHYSQTLIKEMQGD